MTDFNSLLKNTNIQAFLKMLRVGEGTSGENGYKTIFTGKTFSDYSAHPRKIYCSGKLCSDAAGAYQFLSTTWDWIRKVYGNTLLPDFSPNSQDLGALARIDVMKNGALDDIVKGDIVTAVNKVKPIWASLPNAGYGQREVSISDTLNNFVKYGGNLFKKVVDSTGKEIVITTKKIKTNPIPSIVITTLLLVSIFAIYKTIKRNK